MISQIRSGRLLKIGQVWFDPAIQQLQSSDGSPISLRPQSGQVLSLLVGNPDKIIEKNQILEQIWSDVSVTDDSLVQCITEIRRAIGDTDRKVIKTYPKRGYMFDSGGNKATPKLDESQFAKTSDQAKTDRVLPTVMVVPPRAFQNGDAAVIGEIFADDLIVELSRSPEINVISRLSSSAVRDQDTNFQTLGETLGIDFVLSGSLRLAGDTAIVILELAEPSTNAILWSDRITTPIASIVDGIECVHQVLSNIRRHVVHNSAQKLKKQSIAEVQSYNILLGAIHSMHKLTFPEFMSARGHLTDVSERHPNHEAPWAWMGRWHVLRLQQGWSDNPHKEADLALECTRRALDLDPDNSLALTCKGHVLANLFRQLDDAERFYDAAIRLNPSDANARLLRGMLHGYMGHGAAAKADTEHALHLAPFDPHRFFFLALAAGANLVAGDYTKALELSDQSLHLNASHTSTLRGKIVAEINLGLATQAHQSAKRLLELEPNFKVDDWLSRSPTGSNQVGKDIATALRAAGLPN